MSAGCLTTTATRLGNTKPRPLCGSHPASPLICRLQRPSPTSRAAGPLGIILPGEPPPSQARANAVFHLQRELFQSLSVQLQLLIPPRPQLHPSLAMQPSSDSSTEPVPELLPPSQPPFCIFLCWSSIGLFPYWWTTDRLRQANYNATIFYQCFHLYQTKREIYLYGTPWGNKKEKTNWDSQKNDCLKAGCKQTVRSMTKKKKVN